MKSKEFEAELKAQHGNSVIWEDRDSEIESGSVDAAGYDPPVCQSMNHKLEQLCERPVMVQVAGRYRGKHKGARWKSFSRLLCHAHYNEWCKLHGLDATALLTEKED